MTSYENLQGKYCFSDGATVRFKNYVVVAKRTAKGYQVEVYQPIESEEETGLDFIELRLENISAWEPEGNFFKTEGEAILEGINYLESL